MTATVKIQLRSRYARGCRALKDSAGRVFFSSRRLISAPTRNDDMFHTVSDGERLRQVAWRKYRDPEKWWIIADYAIQDGHRMLFPDRDLEAGMVLRMPSAAQAERILSERYE